MFSVVIPVYNQARTLPATIASVRAQDFAGFEAIIVDDGSTDGGVTEAVLGGDPRLRIVRQANAGTGGASNRGMAEARHDWIAIVAGDDLWLPDHLSELDRVRRAFPDAGLIGTVSHRVAEGAPLPGMDPYRAPPERVDWLAEIARGRLPFTASSAAIARSTVAALGGFSDVRQGQDSEYWARIALAFPIAASRRRTAIYVQRPGSISAGVRAGGKPPPACAADLSPVVAYLCAEAEARGDPALCRAVDGVVARYAHWRTAEAAARGDIATLRALAPLFPAAPELKDRIRLALARLPASIAAPLLRALHR
jgi:glycosyltransferase involved in cell wall biosynthesis